MKNLFLSAFLMANLFGQFADSASLDISNVPLFINNRVDPNVLFDMSIEGPMGGAAYSGPTGATSYSAGTTFLGYFDPNKCYTYSSDRFNPVGATGDNHTCSGQWSGNLLNWAGMTAIDEFRWALTGGDRYVDTTTETVIVRASATSNSSWFPVKRLNAGVNVAPSTVTPYADADIYLTNHGLGKTMKVGTSSGGSQKGTLHVRVKVCDASVGLETNCTQYGTSSPYTYKPTGLIQNNSSKMRFALTSYLADNSKSRDGGVLRSKMKYTGPEKYVIESGMAANANTEWSATTGIFVSNPDPAEATASSVSNSGVINYINKFGASGYKDSDPAGELYYESLRYFKNLGNTPEYSSDLTTAMKDGFPVITVWDDPIQDWCQKNFIVGINDANPWLDKKLPGTYFTCARSGTSGLPAFSDGDCGEPSNPDPDINVKELTDRVGELEGLNGISWSSTGIWTSTGVSDSVTGTNDSVGYFPGDTSPGSCVAKTITSLGEVMGTCPDPIKQNSYYIAGLAFYANTTDIRPDFKEKQTIATYMIDTQEYKNNPLDGPRNMLWLAGKYGGFIDSDDSGTPNVASEWDSDGDGMPDNYVLATEPEKLVEGLNSAFADIIKRTGSASAVATSSTELNTGSRYYLAQFASEEWSGTLVSTFLSTDTVEWDAAEKLDSKAAGDRVILTKAGTSGVPFRWDNLTGTVDTAGTQQYYLDRDETLLQDDDGEKRLNYLRGDHTEEGTAAGTFRQRPTGKLGDIINSSPWYVGKPETGYSDVDYPGYSTFSSDFSKRFPVVYVGANDGMLHGFNACDLPVYSGDPAVVVSGQVGCTAALQGSEVIAYVPTPVYSNLSWLTSQDYRNNTKNHRYFVDGHPMVGDAYLSSKSSWRSVLVGGLNSGGKAFYALDVTNPGDTALAAKAPVFSESNASSLVLWEFTDNDDADLGLTYNLPPIDLETGSPRQIVRLKPYEDYPDGRWAVIVGNGYNSSQGYAALYIIFLDGPTGTGGVWVQGTDYIKIVAAKSASGGNGLSSPLPYDADGDGYIDTVYAGDLQGNMWRFLVGPHATSSLYEGVSSTPSTWKVAYSTDTCAETAPSTCTPLFVADDGVSPTSNRQPILSPPVVTRHPDGGLMVLFGTGKYLSSDDALSDESQSFYGIKDTDVTVSGRDVLVYQNLSTASPPTITATTTPELEPPAVIKGWYTNFSISGERLVGRPNVKSDIILFDGMAPSTDACSGGVMSRIIGLNYLDGSMSTVPLFDTNGDGAVDEKDDISAGVDTGSSLGGHSLIKGSLELTSNATHTWIASQTKNLNDNPEVESGGVDLSGDAHTRINWREILP
jgi:type IV pilus assembly protein PilY1